MRWRRFAKSLGVLVCAVAASCAVETTPTESAAEVDTTAVSVTASPIEAAPAIEEPAQEPLVFIAGGDVNLGRDAGQQVLASPEYNPLRALKPLFATADLRFINLESPLSFQRGQTQSPHHPKVFTGPPEGAETLKLAGVDIVSTANNHAWDYGRKAFLQTMANLQRVEIPYVGGTAIAGNQYEPVIVKVKGWSIAFFAVTHIWNLGPFKNHVGQKHVAWANPQKLASHIKRAKAEHDLVFVSYHGGVEYSDLPYPPQRKFIATMMDMGIDALIGHHPHVPRGVGFVEGRPAFYSLGNLVFDKRSDNRWERTSYAARMTFRRDGNHDYEICPYDLIGHEPRPFRGKRRKAAEAELRQHLKIISRPLGGAKFGESDALGCMPVGPSS